MKKSRQIELLEAENAILKEQLKTLRVMTIRYIEQNGRKNEEMRRLREECISINVIEEFFKELAGKKAAHAAGE